MNLNILILEDNHEMRNYLKELVLKYHSDSSVFLSKSGEEALKVLKKYDIDLLLLDIELNEENKNGIYYGKKVQRKYPNTDYIIITGHTEYALLGYDLHAYYYFTKPIDPKIFKIKLDSWVERRIALEFVEKSIQVKTADGIEIIPLNKIIFIENSNRKLIFVTESKEYLVDETMKSMASKLDNKFFKSYQSFYVNLCKISKIERLENRSSVIRFFGVEKTAMLSRYNEKEFMKLFDLVHGNGACDEKE